MLGKEVQRSVEAINGQVSAGEVSVIYDWG